MNEIVFRANNNEAHDLYELHGIFANITNLLDDLQKKIPYDEIDKLDIDEEIKELNEFFDKENQRDVKLLVKNLNKLNKEVLRYQES